MNENTEEGMMVDKAFADLFDAYERVAKLERAQTATEAREAATRIKKSMELFIERMVRFGVRAEENWARIRRAMLKR